MALNGTIQTSYYNGVQEPYVHYLVIEWSVKQDINNNTSTFNWVCKSEDGSGNYYVYIGPIRLYFDKQLALNIEDRIKVVRGQQLGSGSITFNHDSNGKKKISVQAEASIYEYNINSTYDGEIEFDDIPRASSISVPTLTMGSEGTITVAKANSSFTHTITYSWGNNTYKENGTICSKSNNTSVPWTPSLNLAKSIPSATSGIGTLTCTTYNGNTKVGQQSVQFTCKVPSSVVPTINSVSVDAVNDNEVINGWGLCVKGYSKVKVNCKANGAYGSTISNYTISGGYSVTTKSLPYTGDIIKSSGDVSFKCVAKDSRGRSSSTKSSSIKVYDYSSPDILKFNVERSSENSIKMIASVSYSFSSVNSKNSAQAILYYKEASSTSWTKYGTINNEEAITLSKDFEEVKSYDFRIIVQDDIGNTDKEEKRVSTVQAVLDFPAGGKGLGIGKICESDTLEVGFTSKFYENINVSKNLQIDGVLTASNLKIEKYTGMDTILSDFGYVSTDGSHGCGIYIIRPFNLIYLRMYIASLSSDIQSSNKYITLCTLKEKFKAHATVALSASAIKDLSVVVKSTCEISIVPRDGFSTTNAISIAGIYMLHPDSELY